ncbi:hypothetical protein GA0115236_11171, partial [Streptomyces sp. IgraMP-1]
MCRAPAPRASSSAARVRAETRSPARSSVPSRSVATSPYVRRPPAGRGRSRLGARQRAESASASACAGPG